MAEITSRLIIDAKGSNAAFGELLDMLKEVRQDLKLIEKDVNTAMRTLGKESKSATKDVKDLDGEIKKINKTLRTNRERFTDATGEVKKIVDVYGDYSRSANNAARNTNNFLKNFTRLIVTIRLFPKKLGKALNDTVKQLEKGADSSKKFAKEIKEVKQVMVDATTATYELVEGVGDLNLTASLLSKTVRRLNVTVGAAILQFTKWAGINKVISTQLKTGIGRVLRFIVGPIGLVIQGVLLLTSSMRAFFSETQKGRDEIAALSGGFDIMGESITQAKAAWFEFLGSFNTQNINGLSSAIMNLRDGIAGIFTSFATAERLNKELISISIEARKVSLAFAESRTEIKKLERIGENVLLNSTERLEALSKAQKIEDALLARRLNLADREIARTTERLKIGGLLRKEQEQITALEIKRAGIETASAELQITLSGKRNSLIQSYSQTAIGAANNVKTITEGIQSAANALASSNLSGVSGVADAFKQERKQLNSDLKRAQLELKIFAIQTQEFMNSLLVTSQLGVTTQLEKLRDSKLEEVLQKSIVDPFVTTTQNIQEQLTILTSLSDDKISELVQGIKFDKLGDLIIPELIPKEIADRLRETVEKAIDPTLLKSANEQTALLNSAFGDLVKQMELAQQISLKETVKEFTDLADEVANLGEGNIQAFVTDSEDAIKNLTKAFDEAVLAENLLLKGDDLTDRLETLNREYSEGKQAIEDYYSTLISGSTQADLVASKALDDLLKKVKELNKESALFSAGGGSGGSSSANQGGAGVEKLRKEQIAQAKINSEANIDLVNEQVKNEVRAATQRNFQLASLFENKKIDEADYLNGLQDNNEQIEEITKAGNSVIEAETRRHNEDIAKINAEAAEATKEARLAQAQIIADLTSSIASDILQAAIDSIQREIDANTQLIASYDSRLNAKEQILAEELRLQEQGLANNADLVQEEIDAIQKSREAAAKREEELKKKQTKTAIIQNQLQFVSEITLAVAKLIGSGAKGGIIGLTIAAAAIPFLFSLITQAKAKSLSFAEGGELASGMIGTPGTRWSSDRYGKGHRIEGTNMVVGGDEFIVNGTTTQQHKGFLHDLNKGTYDSLNLQQMLSAKHTGTERTINKRSHVRNQDMLNTAMSEAMSGHTGEMLNYMRRKKQKIAVPPGSKIIEWNDDREVVTTFT